MKQGCRARSLLEILTLHHNIQIERKLGSGEEKNKINLGSHSHQKTETHLKCPARGGDNDRPKRTPDPALRGAGMCLSQEAVAFLVQRI